MNFRNIKFDSDKGNSIEFIKKNVREFYSQEIFDWQYGNSNSNLFVGIDDQLNLIGTQGMIYVEMKNQGSSFHSSKSETTFLSEIARGTGAFEKMYQLSIQAAFESGSEFIWGFTALGALWEKKLGFNYSDVIHESVIFIKPNPSDNFKKKLLKNGVRLLLKLKLSFISKVRVEVTDNVSQFSFNPDFYESDGISLDYSSETFLNRTSENPFIKYSILKVYKYDNQIASILFQHEFDSFIISDIQYIDESYLKLIFKSIISYATSKTSCSEVKFWANKYNPKYNLVFLAMKNFFAKEYAIKDMQLIYKSKKRSVDISKLFINSIWTEGFKY
jgi:hypothetical protein